MTVYREVVSGMQSISSDEGSALFISMEEEDSEGYMGYFYNTIPEQTSSVIGFYTPPPHFAATIGSHTFHSVHRGASFMVVVY